MAFGIINRFEGGTQEQYEAAVAVVHPPGGLPAGQTHHFAGSDGDGWVVVAVWDSQESWNTFRDGTLMPGLQGLGEAGFAGPPEVTEFTVANELHG